MEKCIFLHGLYVTKIVYKSETDIKKLVAVLAIASVIILHCYEICLTKAGNKVAP